MLNTTLPLFPVGTYPVPPSNSVSKESSCKVPVSTIKHDSAVLEVTVVSCMAVNWYAPV